MSIKVGFDLSKFQSGHNFRGVGSYATNLLKELKKLDQIDVTEKFNPEEVDLIHIPHFDFFQPSLKINEKVPTVVTIFDTIPLNFPEHYPPGILGRINLFRQKHQLKKASAIITISESTKQDIHKKLLVSLDKISSVYLAVGDEYKVINNQTKLNQIKSKYNLPDKFLLFIGNVNWNKNLVNLTQACINNNTDLVLVGKSFNLRQNLNHPELQTYKEFLNKFSENKLVHIKNFIETSDLVGILNLSQGLLLPSYYEGFGITILEAQSCGVPVVTGSTSSMPEVAGNSALFADPYNIHDLTDKVKKLLNDQKVKSELIKLGFINLKRFSWQKTAELTAKVYENVLQKSR